MPKTVSEGCQAPSVGTSNMWRWIKIFFLELSLIMIYLGSTVNLFLNNYILKYVTIDNKGITAHCNGGNTYVD